MQSVKSIVASSALFIALLCSIADECSAQSVESESAHDRPKIGLALSGGGARGAAHIGAIRELERLRVPVDFVAGTSMGAIVGGLYAAGLSTDDMKKVLVDIDWDEIFRDRPEREFLSRRRKFDDAVFQVDKSFGIKDGKLKGPTGVIQGRKLDLLLERVIAPVRDIDRFDDFPIPFRAVATDIVTGEGVVLDSGNLATAIRASMSVPGAFAPVEIDGRLLVDGGIADNLPVDVVRRMGADVVIAVDISTPLLNEDQLDSAVAIVSQLSGFLTRKNTEQQIASLTESDVFIAPPLGDIASFSFKRANEAVGIGQAAAVAASKQLNQYALDADEYKRHITARDRPHPDQQIIHFVRIDNRSSIDDAVVRARVQQQIGQALDLSQLEQDLGELYGLDIFESVRYDLVSERGRTGLVIEVAENPWGPRYLQFGARFSSDLGDEQELGFTAGYTVTPINRLGGEWRSVLRLGEEQGLVTELYQPIAVDSPYFLLPRLFLLNQQYNEFEDGGIIASNRAKRIGGQFILGRELGTWARISASVLRASGDLSTRIGVSDVEPDFDDGQFSAAFELDTLDNVNFPTSGALGLLRWTGSRTGLGADSRYDQLRIDTTGAWTRGRHTVLLGARYFRTVSGDTPVQGLFRSGGLFELPGFADNALSGQHLVLLRSGYQRGLGEVFGFPGYLGLTLQFGNVFEEHGDIDIDNAIFAAGGYLGLDTILGPLYVGYGQAEGGESALYFILGARF